MTKPFNPQTLRQDLLRWYDRASRQLPWRSTGDMSSDPYHVWLSEIMLQQTTVVTVIPYFVEFVTRWPTITDLAKASLDDVLHAWQGLGYYARARNLHACAKHLAETADGVFPNTIAQLQKLPGIGPYTASAIASIAFLQPTVPVDGNVERVLSRLHAISEPLPASKKQIGEKAQVFADQHRPGDFAQAFMELGALVCKPKSPNCPECPWQNCCVGHRQGNPERFPVRLPKPPKPTRKGVVFWLARPDGAVMLRRREEKGLLGGMMEFPSTDWREQAWSQLEAVRLAPGKSRWRELPGTVRHTFTHFHLELTVWSGETSERISPERISNDAIWARPDEFHAYALPTLMKKVVQKITRRN